MPTPAELSARMARDRSRIAVKLDGDYVNARAKRISIWNEILNIEITTGSTFLVAVPENVPYLCVGLTQEILAMPRPGRGGDRFWTYIERRYGITEREEAAKAILDRYRSYAMQNGAHVAVRRFAAYKNQTVYFSSYNGQMWRLDGENIMQVVNGEDDVFFIDDDGGKHVDPEVGEHGILFDRLVNHLSFSSSGMGGISDQQMRMAFIVWIFALALPDLMPTKPLLILEGAPGSGKCLQLGTPVLCFDGSTKAVEDVQIGDLLMGPDSRPRRVLATTRGRGPLFKICPVKGDSWVCNDAHVLTLVSSHRGEIIDISVDQFLSETAYFRSDYKQFMTRVDFPPQKEPLPIDPYFLGVWYGDGTVVGDGTAFPKQYLTASREARAQFLAGLLDTDGYLSLGCLDIVQKRRGFADGICFLARSLGLRATPPKAKFVLGYEEPYWHVSISGDMNGLPLRIPRKKPDPRHQIKDVTRTGITIDPIGEGDFAGFTLDEDGRFLLGDFTVTHNSSAVQLLQQALLGEAKPMILSKNKEDDFGVLLLRSPIAVFDNLDAYIDWLPDAICSYTTKGTWTKRKLFTDSEEATIKPHAFIAVASKNPASFRREDTADRCVILRLDRREQFTRFQSLEEEIQQLRPQIVGEYMWYVNQIVAEIRHGALTESATEVHRMADFAALARVVGRVVGWEPEAVADLLNAVQGEQIAFINEEDPLVELLHKWIVYRPRNAPSNVGRELGLFQLFQEMETLANAHGIQFYKNARLLSQKLRSQHIERDFIVQLLAPDGHKSYRIWRKTDARLTSIPALDPVDPTGSDDD